MIAVLAASLGSASAEPANFHHSYTVHPIGLVVGVYQVSGEWRTADKVGVLASPQVTYRTFPDRDDTTDLEEVGAGASIQGRYYALGTFPTGLFLGGLAGAFYDSVHGKQDGEDAELQTTTIAFGAVAGGKVSFPVGLTLDADLGIAFAERLQTASVGTTTSFPGSASNVHAVLDIRAGWSF
jgi:hypothetical protein